MSGRVRLHGQAGPSKLPAFRVLPMNLPRGEVLTDEISESRVIMGRLYATEGGKAAQVRVQRLDQPDVTMIWTWEWHEHISVKRATVQEGKR